MARKDVVAKRGCTCCGTGCSVMAALGGGLTFALWETFGVLALVVWPALFAAAHAVRFATGHRQTWEP